MNATSRQGIAQIGASGLAGRGRTMTSAPNIAAATKIRSRFRLHMLERLDVIDLNRAAVVESANSWHPVELAYTLRVERLDMKIGVRLSAFEVDPIQGQFVHHPFIHDQVP